MPRTERNLPTTRTKLGLKVCMLSNIKRKTSEPRLVKTSRGSLHTRKPKPSTLSSQFFLGAGLWRRGKNWVCSGGSHRLDMPVPAALGQQPISLAAPYDSRRTTALMACATSTAYTIGRCRHAPRWSVADPRTEEKSAALQRSICFG